MNMETILKCCRFLDVCNFCDECSNKIHCSERVKCSRCCGELVEVNEKSGVGYGKTEWSKDGQYRYVYRYIYDSHEKSSMIVDVHVNHEILSIKKSNIDVMLGKQTDVAQIKLIKEACVDELYYSKILKFENPRILFFSYDSDPFFTLREDQKPENIVYLKDGYGFIMENSEYDYWTDKIYSSLMNTK